MPDIFFLYFSRTKHCHEVNSIFRDWLASLGNHVYDLSDSKYDVPSKKSGNLLDDGGRTQRNVTLFFGKKLQKI
jgi:hypothetical protein